MKVTSKNSSVLLRRFLFTLAFVIAVFTCIGQTPYKGYEKLFTPPKGYVARFTDERPLIDGNINDPAWAQAPWSGDFQDIEGDNEKRPFWKTKFKMLWNDSCLFIAAALEDPHVWATLKQHDAIVYHDNDFEVFIDPDNDTHQYFEIEVNALNTIFDLFLSKPYRNGTGALIPFDIASLQSGVQVQGTLNNAADRDSGWTVELAIPFRSLAVGKIWKAHQEDAVWRINFSRVHWDTDIVDGNYHKRKDQQGRYLPEHNWVWSPQGVINMHYPERWGYLTFTRNATPDTVFLLPYYEKQKQYLWLAYYRQKEFFSKNGRYAKSLKELSLKVPMVGIDGKQNKLKMEATSRQFSVYISDEIHHWSINDEGLLKAVKALP